VALRTLIRGVQVSFSVPRAVLRADALAVVVDVEGGGVAVMPR
jgi:hypothetical protein